MSQSGLAYGLLAFLLWGFAPVYFKALATVPAMQVLAHRVIWSSVFLVMAMLALKKWQAAKAVLKPRVLASLALTSLLIGTNWYLFIWAVADGRILEASLGYYINPLVTVLLGVIVLRERMTPAQALALVLAFLGVLILVARSSVVPWVSLALAGSFASYTLIRKTLRVDSLVGLTLETLVLAPVALFYLSGHTDGFATATSGTQLLLVLAGVLTAMPLLWFVEAARRLPLSVLGFLQYLSPTCQFMLAVWVYGETFDATRLLSFAFIWGAVLVFAFSQSTTLFPPNILRTSRGGPNNPQPK